MSVLQVVTYPNPVLNKKAEPCDISDSSLKKLAEDMLETMYKFNGVGLAAPQIGVSKRLVVIDVDQDEKGNSVNPMVLINPEIVKTSGSVNADDEGCLSCPGITVSVFRKPYCKVRFSDLEGNLWEIEGDGLLGRCLQHELDHLEGKTMFEAISPSLRKQALEQYEEAKLAGAIPGQTTHD